MEGARVRSPIGAAVAVGVALLVSVVLLESCAYAVYYAREGSAFPKADLRRELADPRLGGPPMPGGLSAHIYAIHPYLGFVHKAGREWPGFDAHGFPGPLAQLARIEQVRERRRRWRRMVSRFPLRESAFALDLGWSVDQRLVVEEVALQADLAGTLGSERRNFQSEGPKRWYLKESELVDDAVAMRSEASVQMSHLATSNGFRYLHFLQPNPHVEGAKPLSQEERPREVGEKESLYRKAIRMGHAVQRREGSDLRARGVAFGDRTMLFQEVSETVYRDSCWHLNAVGSSLLTDAIVDEILIAYRNGSPAP